MNQSLLTEESRAAYRDLPSADFRVEDVLVGGRTRLRRRRGVRAAGAVAALTVGVLSLGPDLVLLDRSSTLAVPGGSASATPLSGGETAGSATGVGPTSTLDEKTADDLALKYIQCVNAAGFKIEHVWVHNLPDTGIMVKTEVDVPAPVHAPCFKSIGGPSTDRSSWGL